MNNKYFKHLGVIVFSLALLVITFNSGFYFGKNNIPAIDQIAGVFNKQFNPGDKLVGDQSLDGKSDSSGVDFDIFWESWKLLEDNYVGKDKINRQDLVYGAAAGLVKSLNDPYTVFFTPTESKKFLEDVSGSFSGIGAEVGIKKGQLLIISPLKDSPAERADLRAKDRILKIDDKSTLDLTIEEAVGLIRGEKGTIVNLLVDRDGFEKLKEFKIKRDTIKIPVIKYEVKNGVAVVSMYSFNQELSSEFRKVSKEIINSGVKKLVIDLRNNPGGYLDVAQEIASYFLPLGKVITIESYANDDKDYLRSRGYDLFKDFKVVVLINSGSASASEILAGALRDNLGYKLIGEKSYGKGSVQEVKDLKDGSSIKVTIAKWLTPNGTAINEVGLEPDIKVEVTEKDIEKKYDAQLEKAIEIINN